MTMPSSSTLLTWAFLYSLPSRVLKSSAKTTDTDRMSTIKTFGSNKEIIPRCFSYEAKQMSSAENSPFRTLSLPHPTEWERTGNQIDAAFVFARSNFVNVHH